MSELTLEAIEKLLERKFEDELSPINTKLDALQETVALHTQMLDQIIKQTKDWNAEMTVMRNRMERYESALAVMAKKLDLDLKPFLQ